MKLDSNRSEQRVPMIVFFLIGMSVGFPFLLLAFAMSPLSDTWLRFVVRALPFTALLALWLWGRSPSTEPSMNAAAQQAFPPGA
jgi:hypothetical protein